MSKKSYFPIDFNILEKGQTLSLGELKEAIPGVEFPSASWNFSCLSLVQKIEDQCGLIARVMNNHTEIQILTDSEAEAWTRARYEKSLQSQVRQIRRRALINTAELSETERRTYETSTGAMIRITAASREQWRRSERLVSARSVARKKLL